MSERAYELSTTLVRNDEHLLPLHLQSDEQILVLYPQEAPTSKAQDKFTAPTALVEGIQKRHTNTQSIAFAANMNIEDYHELLRMAQKAFVIIIATINAQGDRQQTDLMHQLLQMERPVIGIAVYGPYDLLSFPQLRTYLTTYEYTLPALEAAGTSSVWGDRGAGTFAC